MDFACWDCHEHMSVEVSITTSSRLASVALVCKCGARERLNHTRLVVLAELSP